MDTSEDQKVVLGSGAVVVHLSQSELEKDIDTAMSAATQEAAPSIAATTGEGDPKRGKKNARFGRNPDGTPAKKADKKEIERKSEWGKYLHDYKLAHPDICSLEATIEARKTYIPKSGKQKSFERIFTEVWKTKNPMWQKMTKEQRTLAIRAAFVGAI